MSNFTLMLSKQELTYAKSNLLVIQTTNNHDLSQSRQHEETNCHSKSKLCKTQESINQIPLRRELKPHSCCLSKINHLWKA